MMVVRELAGTVHGGKEGTTTARLLLLRLLMCWMLHSRSWSSHVIRMMMVVMMASRIQMGCDHTRL